MRQLVICWLFLLGCGGDPLSPETEILSAFMSIANVSRDPIFNPEGEIITKRKRYFWKDFIPVANHSDDL